MLVLSRKSNEEIVIAGGIRLKVIDIGNSRVKLGICAPDDVVVLREELAPRSTISPEQHRGSIVRDSIHLKG